ncbi:MAG: diacylglycerol/lipid kinase family protein, partial [Phycisphaeraceae bacterium]
MPDHATTTATATAAASARPPTANRGSVRASTNDRASASSRVAVVANPFSGTGPNRRRVERLLATLREKGLDPHVCWTPAERRAAFEGPGAFRCAVVAGGDGSIADAINELDRAGRLEHTPLATLPMGNENLFADAMGFGKQPGPLADAIASAASKPIDLGSAGGRMFALMVSAGLDAEVVRRMDRWRSRTPLAPPTPGAPAARDWEESSSAPRLRRVNRTSYAVRTLAALRAYGYPPLRLETDDAEITGSHAFVFNIARYGGGLHIAPVGAQRVHDGG